MSHALLTFLDWLLGAFHVLVVLANVLLWIPRRTRRVHLILVSCTAASWLGLGAFYGLGYCFLTDWQWQVKRTLGKAPVSGGFIQYLVDAAGLQVAPSLVNAAVGWTFAVVFVLSLVVNFWWGKREGRSA